MQLPIDVIPGTNPPLFKWTQTFDSTTGMGRVQQCEGVLSPSVEQAVLALIQLAKTQHRGMVGPDSMTEVVATQGKRNEEQQRSIELLLSHDKAHVELIEALRRDNEALAAQLVAAQEEVEKLRSELLSLKGAPAQGKRGRVG